MENTSLAIAIFCVQYPYDELSQAMPWLAVVNGQIAARASTMLECLKAVTILAEAPPIEWEIDGAV